MSLMMQQMWWTCKVLKLMGKSKSMRINGSGVRGAKQPAGSGQERHASRTGGEISGLIPGWRGWGA